MKEVLTEAALVAMCGVVLSFAANELSPRGLKLDQDFFPSTPRHSTALAPAALETVSPNQMTNSVSDQLAAQLRQEGLELVDNRQVVRLFHEPGYADESIVFIDARDDEHYQAGHIPGAYQLDHYHAEKYFPNVVPVCLKAARIVVYCNGGECEDSKFTAILLRDAGIPKEKLAVYAGGITEWQAFGLPTEAGERKSPGQTSAK